MALLAACVPLLAAAHSFAQAPGADARAFDAPPRPVPDLAPPRLELPAGTPRPGRLGLGPDIYLAPSMLEQFDSHDPHKVLEERGLGGGREGGPSTYLPERLGATLTFPF